MTKTKESSTPKGSTFNTNKTLPARKDLGSIKHKFSPVKKMSSKHNNVFIKAFKFGLMCLELKKPTDPNEDAYFKDFLDILDSDAAVSEKLHSFFNLYLLLLTLMASPAAAFNSTTILVVDAFFTSCLWRLKMLLWWLSCFKWDCLLLLLLLLQKVLFLL